MGEFNDKVYETVRRVPRGKVVSYGQVARLIGQPRKARFVGMPCISGIPTVGLRGSNGGIPCHRVVFKGAVRLHRASRSAGLTNNGQGLLRRA